MLRYFHYEQRRGGIVVCLRCMLSSSNLHPQSNPPRYMLFEILSSSMPQPQNTKGQSTELSSRSVLTIKLVLQSWHSAATENRKQQLESLIRYVLFFSASLRLRLISTEPTLWVVVVHKCMLRFAKADCLDSVHFYYNWCLVD